MQPDAERRRAALQHFDALSEVDATELQRRLDAIRRATPDVAALLERMLEVDQRRDGVLDGSLRSLAPTVVADLESAALPPSPASGAFPEIAGLSVLRHLGSGGMGEVFLAERGSGEFRQMVALKLLRTGMDSHEIRRRFMRERQILATLEHPGIARFIDAGMAADGRPWLAMEFVEGTPIDVHARERGLGLRDRVTLILQVCRAVAHAQSRLVVHRDIKPSNILIDNTGRPRLLDFGIAKLIEAPDQPSATRTLLRAMSPAYAAPEQWRSEAVSTSTDVYALGLVLHELICGRLPDTDRNGPEGFRSGDVERGPGSEILAHPLAAAMALGLDRDATLRLGREARGDLDLILRRALRVDPGNRYQGAGALAEDLQAWLDRRPISARPDSRLYHLRRFVARNRLGVALGGLALLALLASWATALEQARRATVEAQRAEEQALRAAESLQRADRSRAFFAGLFSASNPTVQAKGAGMTVVDFVSDAAARLETQLDGLPAEQAEIGVGLAGVLNDLGKPREALDAINAAIERLRKLDPQGSPRLAIALGRRGIALNQLSRSREAEADAREALAMFEQLPGEHALEQIRTRTSLLVALTQQGRLEDIVEQSLAVLRDRASLLGEHDPALAVDWFNLGMAYVHADQPALAVEALGRSDALLTADPATSETRRAWVLTGLSGAQRILGDLEAAAQAGAEAGAVARRTLGEDHPITISADHGVTMVDFDRGDDPSAVARRIRERMERLDSDNQNRIRISVDLSEVLLAAGEDAEVRAVLEPLTEKLANNAPDDPQYLRARANLAFALARLGDSTASGIADDLADESSWPPGTAPRFRAEASVHLAAAQRLLGNAEAAERHAEHARLLLDRMYHEGHPRRRMLLQRL